MKQIIVAFFTALTVMLVLDAVWLGFMVKRFYAPRIGHLMADSVSIPPAVFFYAIYIAGLCYLAVLPAVGRGSGAPGAFLAGFVYGAVTYGTYDLTNQATLRDWPLSLTLADMAWGAMMTGTAGMIAALAAART